jgi:hypothetical protein
VYYVCVMCVYIYIYMCKCACVYVCTSIYVCVSTSMYVCMYAFIHSALKACKCPRKYKTFDKFADVHTGREGVVYISNHNPTLICCITSS